LNSLQTSATPGKVKAWISAFRLRTLPLALASMGMGSFLAAADQQFRGSVVAWSALTTLFLQILSNLANDYGDTKHGADGINRKGPPRAVQTGLITPGQMKTGMFIFAMLSLLSGLTLLWISFGPEGIYLFFIFLMLGLAAIWAAINYTAGDKPYGYAGLGDISVFIFFGLVGVTGTYFLQTQSLPWPVLWPAAALGFFSTAVLNINNIRDIHSDKLAGKNSVPVRLGGRKARIYHIGLLVAGMVCAIIYAILQHAALTGYLFLLTMPLFYYNAHQIWHRQNPEEIDPYLKQMALSTLAFVLLFGIGFLL